MAFTDDFNRSNENLETSADWTRVDGTAGAATVTSNEVSQDSTTDSAYQCPDQSSADHYTQIDQVEASPSNTTGFVPCNRITDINNFIGARNTQGTWELYKRDSGSFTLLDSTAGSITGGPTLKLDSDGNDHELFINTVSTLTATDSFNNTETRQGCAVRHNDGPWFDDFEADVLAAGGATGKSNPLSGPLGGPLAGPIG